MKLLGALILMVIIGLIIGRCEGRIALLEAREEYLLMLACEREPGLAACGRLRP